MYTKKLSSVGLVALLLLGLVMLAAPASAKPAPAGGGAIWVEPEFVNGTLVGLDNTFVVELWINISETAGPSGGPYGMYAFAYWLSWNDTLLELTSWNTYYPSGGVWAGGAFVVEDKLKDIDTNGKNDTHSYSVTALGMDTGFTGAMMLANYTFKVTYVPELEVSSLFHITDQGFADANEEPIPMTGHDGTYWVPEFPAVLIIPLFIITTLAAAILGKKAWLRKRSSPFVVKVAHSHHHST